MDWFEQLTGFREATYAATRAQLEIRGTRLHSRGNGASYGIGELSLPSLQSLHDEAATAPSGRPRTRIAQGDVRDMHTDRANAGALFQVASQFNMLEMTGPEVTPEHGVTGYAHDRTQGPACAIACGAATIYRNYFAPVGTAHGQTARHQLDGLADLGTALGAATGLPVTDLWDMRNGYALGTRAGLDAITGHLRACTPEQIDGLRGHLRIGLHRDVEVTLTREPRPLVSQAFCSALPVAYSRVPAAHWYSFAVLVLEAAYEATLWAAVLNARRGISNVVFLTALGGGAFGNDAAWIDSAMRRALTVVPHDLDVRLVSYGQPSPAIAAIAADFR